MILTKYTKILEICTFHLLVLKHTQLFSFSKFYIQVFDVDSTSPLSNDVLGLAVQNLSANIPGIWEVLIDSTWMIVNASRCNPLLLFPGTQLRFRPFPNFAKMDGLASVMFR